MIYRCIRNLPIPKIDEEGRVTEDVFLVKEGSLWKVDNQKHRETGNNSTIRLIRLWKSANCKTSPFIEIMPSTLSSYFKRKKYLKEIREKQGMSQSQFSDRLGISVRTLQEWEQKRKHEPAYLADLIEELFMQEKMNILEKLNNLYQNTKLYQEKSIHNFFYEISLLHNVRKSILEDEHQSTYDNQCFLKAIRFLSGIPFNSKGWVLYHSDEKGVYSFWNPEKKEAFDLRADGKTVLITYISCDGDMVTAENLETALRNYDISVYLTNGN